MEMSGKCPPQPPDVGLALVCFPPQPPWGQWGHTCPVACHPACPGSGQVSTAPRLLASQRSQICRGSTLMKLGSSTDGQAAISCSHKAPNTNAHACVTPSRRRFALEGLAGFPSRPKPCVSPGEGSKFEGSFGVGGAHFSRAKSFPCAAGPGAELCPGRPCSQTSVGLHSLRRRRKQQHLQIATDVATGATWENNLLPGFWGEGDEFCRMGRERERLCALGHTAALGSQDQEVLRGRSRQWLKELTAPATGIASHRPGACPAQRSRSPHPSAHGLGGLPCGAGGEHRSSRRGDGHSRAKELGSEWEGARAAAAPHREAGGHVALRCSLPPGAGLHACCRWLPLVSPHSWGWLLTSEPHASSLERPAPSTHH